MRRVSHKPRPAFTLVELLMVVTIIGILIGLLVPALYYGLQTVKKQAIGVELQTLASAVEQYKNKFGDYPPDGTNREVFKRHFRGRFRQMAESEFDAVDTACNCVVLNAPQPPALNRAFMDPPEALVFALGGFSTDPLKPFTGAGGPLQPISGGYQYNTDRTDPLYEFKEAQLTLSTSSGTAQSTDEVDYGYGANDAMPVYRAPYRKSAPFVYFDARSYGYSLGASSTPQYFFNSYGTSQIGVARPYKSDKINTNAGTTAAAADSYYKYVNDRTFQLISAGLDDNFGGIIQGANDNGPVFFRYPSGEVIDFRNWTMSGPAPTLPSLSRYDDGDVSHPQFDNVANFADGLLQDGLTN